LRWAHGLDGIAWTRSQATTETAPSSGASVPTVAAVELNVLKQVC
jgi:hypothetical protein